MPGFDGTGPMGGGPMTGGRRGYCVPGQTPVGRPFGGWGRGTLPGYGRGFGRGFRWRTYWPASNAGNAGYAPPYNATTELSALKDQAEFIKNELNQIQSRIDELESS